MSGRARRLERAGLTVVALVLVAGTGCRGEESAPAASSSAAAAGATTPAPAAPEVRTSRTPAPAVAPAPAPPPTTDQRIAGAPRQSALALLGTLAVKGRAAKTGYGREQFGPAWTDTNRNGCDTRNDILARDLTAAVFRAGTRSCVVVSGRLAEPYVGAAISFSNTRGDAVHIDHVVSLSNAWQTGAFGWVAGKRLAFANDPTNLLAVDGAANMAKSDGDAATWLPPNKAYRCALVARQTGVKAKYQLWVTPPERDAIARVLTTCPTLPAPGGGNPTMAPVAAPRPASPAAPATPRPTTAPAPPSGVARDYANCDEMHEDYRGGVARPGAVDRRRNGGHARYAPHYDQALYDANEESDGDDDGVACEQ